MSLLSAQTLFHYTEKEHLINILKYGLFPRYSKEFDSELSSEEQLIFGKFLYIPMVCFCDTPLSSVKNHMDVYGSYGIGLSKQWGIRNRLNPVFYIKKESILHSNLIEPMQFINIKYYETDKELLQKLAFIYRYMKPYAPQDNIYKRKNKRTGEVIEYPNYSYYDEKEWRYVPDNLQPDQYLSFDDISDLEKEEYNKKLVNHSLTFTAQDIKFIIIDREEDIDDIMKAVCQSELFKAADEKHILTTFLTTDGIKQNF